jgi:hypothetical protein
MTGPSVHLRSIPSWGAEAADDLSDNVIYLTERHDDRAAA